MNMIMPADFEKRMKEIAEIDDIPERHVEADKLLIEVLDSLGYSAGTEIYKNMKRWYS